MFESFKTIGTLFIDPDTDDTACVVACNRFFYHVTFDYNLKLSLGVYTVAVGGTGITLTEYNEVDVLARIRFFESDDVEVRDDGKVWTYQEEFAEKYDLESGYDTGFAYYDADAKIWQYEHEDADGLSYYTLPTRVERVRGLAWKICDDDEMSRRVIVANEGHRLWIRCISGIRMYVSFASDMHDILMSHGHENDIVCQCGHTIRAFSNYEQFADFIRPIM